MKKDCRLKILMLIFLFANVPIESHSQITKQKASNLGKWVVPTYQGLALGKSKKADVLRLFGKPSAIVHPEDEYDNPVRSLISFYYYNVGGLQGNTEITMRIKTGVVTTIILYPDDLTFENVIERFGTNYIERDMNLGPCPTAREKKASRPSREKNYPLFLVYPQKGLYVFVGEENKVRAIVYLLSCP